jgi:putative FmdB family regulatory protein
VPLYEYSCTDCHHQFETLVRGGRAPECPACHGTSLEKQLSVFAAHAGGPSTATSAAPMAGACGACGDPRGPGAWSLN